MFYDKLYVGGAKDTNEYDYGPMIAVVDPTTLAVDQAHYLETPWNPTRYLVDDI